MTTSTLTSGGPEDDALFEVEAPPPVSLADKFLFPPMSILDRRSGEWQDRKRAWLRLGIRSEVGRADGLIYAAAADPTSVSGKLRHNERAGWKDSVTAAHHDYSGGTSVFDPVVCELVYRWFSAPGARVLDPFAGGSVRGVTASTLARDYLGIDLRDEQVEANREQSHLGSTITPHWIAGDSRHLDRLLDPGYEADLVFSCPPYADLEVYSDDPADLSTMRYGAFVTAYRDIITAATARLRPDRFAAWVISDVRDQRTGAYRGLVADTIRAFRDAGLELHNDAILVDQIGTSALRAERPFVTTRKLTRTHQHVLVFIKGDAKRAAAWAGGAAS